MYIVSSGLLSGYIQKNGEILYSRPAGTDNNFSDRPRFARISLEVRDDNDEPLKGNFHELLGRYGQKLQNDVPKILTIDGTIYGEIYSQTDGFTQDRSKAFYHIDIAAKPDVTVEKLTEILKPAFLRTLKDWKEPESWQAPTRNPFVNVVRLVKKTFRHRSPTPG